MIASHPSPHHSVFTFIIIPGKCFLAREKIDEQNERSLRIKKMVPRNCVVLPSGGKASSLSPVASPPPGDRMLLGHRQEERVSWGCRMQAFSPGGPDPAPCHHGPACLDIPLCPSKPWEQSLPPCETWGGLSPTSPPPPRSWASAWRSCGFQRLMSVCRPPNERSKQFPS